MSKKRSRATKQSNAQAAAARAAAIRKAQASKERRRRSLAVSAVVVVVLALIFGIGYAVQSSRDTTGQAGSAPSGADGVSIPIGQSNAPVTVEIYEDFLCPYCGDLESASKGWLQQYIDEGKVRVKYHVVAILDSGENNDYSTRAANAFASVLNASGPTTAKKFHDLLYENQPEEGTSALSDKQLVDLAVQAGASESVVTKALAADTYGQWVSNGTDAMSKRKVTGTPTVFVDGSRLSKELSMDQLASTLKGDIDAKIS